MRRFPAFDPPEYVSWRPEPALVAQFRATIDAHPERAAVIAALERDALLDLYRGLLRARLHDITLKRWVRTGVISKAWLGTGEEAVTVGPVHALARDRDVVAPMIRNAAACVEMGIPLAAMLRAYLATADSPSAGRDLHVGDLSRGVLQPISHVGDMVPVVAGVALAFRMRGEPRVVLTWIGDGTTKSAATHEGTNFAAVQHLPAILIVQNNQVALGTRLEQHHLPGNFADWAASYGISGGAFDGNNVLDAYAATRVAATQCRAGAGPVLLVAETFRMGGHATHDEREARETFAPELFAQWGRRDPVGLYEEHLKTLGWTDQDLAGAEADVTVEGEPVALWESHSLRAGSEVQIGISQGPGFRPHNYVRDLVAYTGTHDNDTTVGWWTSGVGDSTRTSQEAKAERELAAKYLDAEGPEIHWAMIRALMVSVADTVVIPLQDVLGLGSEARMNLPGRPSGNWRWRVKTGAFDESLRGRLRELTELYGRAVTVMNADAKPGSD